MSRVGKQPLETVESGSKQSTPPWEGFIVGEENRLALASVQALARGEVEGYSPLVLHGPSGAGKSRLLEGLVADRLMREPGSSVAKSTAESFAIERAEAANSDRNDAWAGFRERFRDLDLFVLEDVHVLERNPATFVELTHTLDSLIAEGAAIAVSARSGPGSWNGWPSRLVDRFLGGLSVRVESPGVESRRRFAFETARNRGLTLASDALDLLAETAAEGYRQLDGLLQRIALSARLNLKIHKDHYLVDKAFVVSVLSSDVAANGPVEIDDLTRAVAAKFGLKPRDLRALDRHKMFVEPRHLAMFLARELTPLSFAKIGDYFHHRDPATVRHACKASAQRLAVDPALASVADSLRLMFRNAKRD